MAYSLKDLVSTGKTLTPPRILVYGGQGLGKSTFGSEFPKPIFLLTETGVDNIDTNKLPMCQTYEDVIVQLTMLEHEDHDYKTLVIDTASGLEKIIEKKVCEENKNARSVASIPFGKGYGEATALFNQVLERFETLRTAKKMIILVICHEKVETIDSPDTEKYDRFNVDLDKRIVPDLNRWVDAILFLRNETFTKKVDESFGKDVYKAVAGQRVLLTQETPAYVAKNRYGLPDKLPFPKTGAAKNLLVTINKIFRGEVEGAVKAEPKEEVKNEDVKKPVGRPKKDVAAEKPDVILPEKKEDDGRRVKALEPEREPDDGLAAFRADSLPGDFGG